MRNAFFYKQMDPMRKSVIVGCFCALALLCFAVFALVPSTAWSGRTVIDQPYDDNEYLYTGTLKAGKFNGYGKIAFANGTRYEGGFFDGRFHGEGVFYGEDWRLEGLFEDGEPVRGVLYGEEEIIFDENSFALAERWKYTGALSPKGQRGKGAFVFEDGATYEGECAEGLAQGRGTYTDSGGHVLYAGVWQAGLYEGEGEYHAPDGSFSYRGNFRGGKFEGEGAVTTREGKVITGTWKRGWRVAE